MSRTIPYLNTLSRTITYLNTLNRIIPYLNTLRKNPNLNQNQILVGSQSEPSTKKTLKPRQPIRIEYHSAETYPILLHCRNIPYLNTWVGDSSRSWARVGCYSLSYYMEGPPPPPPPVWSAHTRSTVQLFLTTITETVFLLEPELKAKFIFSINKVSRVRVCTVFFGTRRIYNWSFLLRVRFWIKKIRVAVSIEFFKMCLLLNGLLSKSPFSCNFNPSKRHVVTFSCFLKNIVLKYKFHNVCDFETKFFWCISFRIDSLQRVRFWKKVCVRFRIGSFEVCQFLTMFAFSWLRFGLFYLVETTYLTFLCFFEKQGLELKVLERLRFSKKKYPTSQVLISKLSNISDFSKQLHLKSHVSYLFTP